MAAGDRTHPVRGEHPVGLDGSSVRETHRHPVAAILEIDEAAPEVEAPLLDRSAQDVLKLGAMNAAIGRAEPASVGVAEANGMRRYPFTGPPVPVYELGRLRRYSDQRFQEPEALEFAGPVRRQRHRGADLGELVSLLVDIRSNATLAERDRQRESADASADDRDLRWRVSACQEWVPAACWRQNRISS